MKYIYKKIWIAVMCAVVCTGMSGCHMKNIDREKIRDLDYIAVEEENIPEEIYEEIVKGQDIFSRKAYVCSDELYIVVCYGAQPTEGYTIEVNYLYESSNAIIVETTLIGPEGPGKKEEKISYPYIVLKLEAECDKEKTVVFN